MSINYSKKLLLFLSAVIILLLFIWVFNKSLNKSKVINQTKTETNRKTDKNGTTSINLEKPPFILD